MEIRDSRPWTLSPLMSGGSLIGEGGCVVTVCVAGYLVLVKAVGTYVGACPHPALPRDTGLGLTTVAGGHKVWVDSH